MIRLCLPFDENTAGLTGYVRDAVLYMASHYGESTINVAKIAGAVGISEGHLSPVSYTHLHVLHDAMDEVQEGNLDTHVDTVSYTHLWAVFLGIAVVAMSAAGCSTGESSGQGPEKVSAEKRLTVYLSLIHIWYG